MDLNDKYEKLREGLNQLGSWPGVHMFKFIITADNKKIALLISKFSSEAVITQKESVNGKYISITVREVMIDADSIIDRYKELETIEGVISL